MKINKLCKVCNNFFQIDHWNKKRIFCNIKCYSISKRKPLPKFNCFHCGIEFFDTKRFKHRKYCSQECKGKSYHKNWKPSYSSIRKRYEIRGWIKSCEICKYDSHPEILGIHHIDGNRKNNDPKNLKVVCPNCHSIEHRKHTVH